MKNILCYEERSLVSTDYCGDPRSSIIDALRIMAVNGTQLNMTTNADIQTAPLNLSASWA